MLAAAPALDGATPWPALIGVAGALLGVVLGAWLTERRERRAARAEAWEAVSALRPLLYQGRSAALHSALDTVEARSYRVTRRCTAQVQALRAAAQACWEDSFDTPDPQVVQISQQALDDFEQARQALVTRLASTWSG